MKKASDRRKREVKKQIFDIRTKIASKLLNEARIGNITFCNPKQMEKDRLNYCEKNMKDDYEQMHDCKNSPGDFCYTCCENEFGRIHEDLRDKCYFKCDQTSSSDLLDWNFGNEIFFQKT